MIFCMQIKGAGLQSHLGHEGYDGFPSKHYLGTAGCYNLISPGL